MAEIKFNCPYYGDYFKSLFTDYLASCSHEKTMREFLSCVRSLCNFAKKDFLDLTRMDVDLFFKDMIDRKLSASTIRIRQNRYSNLLRFINETENADNPYPDYFAMLSFPAPEDYELSQDIVKSYVTEEQYSRLVRAAGEEVGESAQLIFALSYCSAMSASEICELRYDHVSRDKDGNVQVYVYDDSFHKDRTILLDRDLGDRLFAFVSAPSKNGSPFVFINKHGNQLTLRNVSALFRKCCRACGIGEEVSFKDLRSTAVVRLLSQTSPEKVAEDANLRTARLSLYKLARKNVAEIPGGGE